MSFTQVLTQMYGNIELVPCTQLQIKILPYRKRFLLYVYAMFFAISEVQGQGRGVRVLRSRMVHNLSWALSGLCARATATSEQGGEVR